MKQQLIFDADDTLWENNIYFERAFDDFVDFLGHSTLSPAQVREVLNEIELASAKVHGYGCKNFGRNRSEEHTSELQSLTNLVCRLLLEKKKPRSRRRVAADERSARRR